MSITQQELDEFYQFATKRIKEQSTLSVRELFYDWERIESQEEIRAAIREGLDDIRNGRTRPVEEFMEEMKTKYNLK